MEQVTFYIIGASLALMAMARIGKAEALMNGGTHWYGVIPRRCIVGRIIGGLHATLLVFTAISMLCVGCGLLIYTLFSTIIHFS